MRIQLHPYRVVAAFFMALLIQTTFCFSTGAQTVPPQPGNRDLQISGDVTLEQAVAMALRLNPMITARGHGVSAAQARLDQAGLYANPEFILEAENFGGGDEFEGFDVSETTFGFEQPILLGGKVRGRKGVASSEYALATNDLDAVRLDVVARTTIAFNNVLLNQEKVRLTDDLLVLTQSFADTVGARVEAGKVSPVDEIRARAAVARARVEVAKATRQLASAKVRLAATWGSTDPDFAQAVGEIPEPTSLPAHGILVAMLSETPEVVRLAEETQLRENVVLLEESRGVPDLRLSAGPRRFNDTGEWAWVGGISIPLPIFDRNQGARRAAEFDLERTRSEVEAQRISLESTLHQRLEMLRAVSGEVRSYQEEIVPASTEAFEAISIGFREGKFGFLEVLDAQRTLSEARLLYLDSLGRYATAHARLERSIGRKLGGDDGGKYDPANTIQGDEQ